MASITKDTTNHVWTFTDTVTSNTYNVVFDTLNKFLDAKIKASLTVQGGTINKPTITANNLLTYFTNDGTASSNDMNLIPQVTNTGGFIAAHTSASPVLGDTKYYNIIHGEGQANTANVVISSTDGSNNGINISSIVGTVADTEPTSGYYLSFTGSGSSKIKTTGWMTAGTTLAAASKTRYFPIDVAAITASSTNATATTTVAPGNVTIAANTTGVSGKSRLALAPTTATSGISTYYIAIKANAAANSTGTTSAISGTATATVTSDGYAPSNLTGSGSVSGTATAKTSSKDSSVYYIPVPTGEGEANTASAEITKTTTDNSQTGGINIGAIIGTRATAEPTEGYYISFSSTGGGSSKIKTAGWFPQGATLTPASTTVERFFPVTAAEGNVSGTNTVSPTADVSGSNVTLGSTDNGISVTATGGGTASVTAQANITTAGYVPKQNNLFSKTLTANSNTTTKTKFISAVTIPSGKSLSVTNNGTLTLTTTGTTNATITNGTTTITSNSTTAGVVKVAAKITASDSSATAAQTIINNGLWNTVTMTAANTAYYGRVTAPPLTVTTSSTNDGMGTYFNTGSASNKDVTITPKYTNTAGYKTATTTATNNSGITYWKIKTTSMTQNKVTTLNSTNDAINTRANASWGTGWITSGSIAPATFANAKDTDKTEDDYVDISNTSDAPILSSGGFLYINRGYVDNLKISLAKLVPDSISGKTMAPANYILTGYAAFNGSGVAINGTMQIYNGAYTVS